MSCTPCYPAGSIQQCFNILAFGIFEAGDYHVFLQHNATGRIQSFLAIPDDDGIIEIEGAVVDPRQGYTIWVTEGNSNDERIEFTVDTTVYTCLAFSVIVCDAMLDELDDDDEPIIVTVDLTPVPDAV